MKKNMKIVAALVSIGLVSPMAYATNGDEMMAVGTENTALGGTGVAHYTGAESTFANPAMLGKSTGSQLNAGIVVFMPTVTNTGALGLATPSPTMATSTQAATSDAKTSYIPDVSYSSRMSDSLTWGIAMAGIAGMGVDYTSATGSAPNQTYFKAKTTLSILDIMPTVAYNTKEYGIGFSPVLQYGSLAISYDTGATNNNPAHNADTNTGFGYHLGGYFNPMLSNSQYKPSWRTASWNSAKSTGLRM